MIKTLRIILLISASVIALTSTAQTIVTPAKTSDRAVPTTKTITPKQQGIGDRIIEKGTQVLEKASQTVTGIVSKYSNMMQVSPNAVSNVILYQFVDEWYGTRYHLGGSSKKGIDCSALVQKLYTYVYGMDVVRTSLMQFRSSTYIADKTKLQEGDLVFFRIHGGPVSHVGIYLTNNYFLHASSSRGVMISNLKENYWVKVYVGGGRIR